MKIIIVGAGIAGLASYHALRKHLQSIKSDRAVSIKLVESHTSPANSSRTIGGGIGLAPNGLRAIASISPEAASYIRERAFSGGLMTFRDSEGRLLGQMKAGTAERYGEFGQVMVLRATVHEALLLRVREEDVQWEMKVVSVKEAGEQVLVEYGDGSSELADLLIGADGIRSVVKDSLFNGAYPAMYNGLTGVGGFIPISSLPSLLQESFDTHRITMAFGKQGFFGYSPCTSLSSAAPFIQWWTVYEALSNPTREKIDKTELLTRYGDWKSPYDTPEGGLYKHLIELGYAADPESRTTIPRHVTPRLPHWSNCTSLNSDVRGRIVLIGDAAHAMTPDLAQGVSCAVEDAVVHALLLKHYLPIPQGFEKAAQAYEMLRMPRVHFILDQSRWNANAKRDMNWLSQTIRDWGIWIFCKLPEFVHGGIFMYAAEDVAADYIAKHPL